MNIVYVVVYSSSITFSFEMFGFDTVDRYLCKPRKLVTSGPNRASLLADFLHSGDPSLRAGSIRIMCVSWCQLDSPWSFENTKNTIEWKFLAIFDLLLLINSFWSKGHNRTWWIRTQMNRDDNPRLGPGPCKATPSWVRGVAAVWEGGQRRGLLQPPGETVLEKLLLDVLDLFEPQHKIF